MTTTATPAAELCSKMGVQQLLGQFKEALIRLETLNDKKGSKGLSRSELACLSDLHLRLESALKEAPSAQQNSPEFQQNLGRFYLFKNDIESAQKAFQKAITIKTTHIESNVSQGRLFMAQLDNESALKHFRRAILDQAQNESEKAAQVFALRKLISGLEKIPERVFEAAKQLERSASLSDDELLALSRFALRSNEFARADEYLARVKAPEKILLQIELYKAQDRQRQLLDKIKEALVKLPLEKTLSPEQFEKLLRDYLATAEYLKDWAEIRLSAELILRRWPSDPAAATAFEAALAKGALGLSGQLIANSKSRLEALKKAAKILPSSATIQERILSELLLSALEQGPKSTPSRETLKVGEIHSARLLALRPESFSALFWRGFIYSRNRSFKNADLRFAELVKRLDAGEAFAASFKEVDFWREVAHVKEARGFYAAALVLLEKGARRLELENERAYLQSTALSLRKKTQKDLQ